MTVFSIAFWLLTLVAMIKVFVKMGYAGWEAIVPLYNAYILLRHCTATAGRCFSRSYRFTTSMSSLSFTSTLLMRSGKRPASA